MIACGVDAKAVIENQLSRRPRNLSPPRRKRFEAARRTSALVLAACLESAAGLAIDQQPLFDRPV